MYSVCQIGQEGFVGKDGAGFDFNGDPFGFTVNLFYQVASLTDGGDQIYEDFLNGSTFIVGVAGGNGDAVIIFGPDIGYGTVLIKVNGDFRINGEEENTAGFGLGFGFVRVVVIADGVGGASGQEVQTEDQSEQDRKYRLFHNVFSFIL